MSPVPGASDLEQKHSYWIEFGKREEQERIIKLLEAQEVEGWFDTGFKQHLIALIKGENK